MRARASARGLCVLVGKSGPVVLHSVPRSRGDAFLFGSFGSHGISFDTIFVPQRREIWQIPPVDRDTMVGVDSTPLYALHPLVPYRMKMVLPRARIVLLLRDPTER